MKLYNPNKRWNYGRYINHERAAHSSWNWVQKKRGTKFGKHYKNKGYNRNRRRKRKRTGPLYL